MNKSELVRAIAKQAGISQADARRVVDALVGSVKGALRGGQDVSIAGFGTFVVRRRAVRTGRNPRSSSSIKIEAQVTPSLRASKKLRKLVSGGTDDPGPSIVSGKKK